MSQRARDLVTRSWLENDGRPMSQNAAHGAMPSWIKIFGKGAQPVQPFESVLVGVQDWRSELVCDGFDLGRVATAGGVAGWIDKSGRLQLTTVRHTIGHTNWNSAELRSAKVHHDTGHKPP